MALRADRMVPDSSQEGICRDVASVLGAVTERESNGPVEGHVNYLKTVYGKCMAEQDSSC
jgi:hypothetical protein